MIRIYNIHQIKRLLLIDNIYKGLLNTDNLEVWTPDVVFNAWFYAIDEQKQPVGIIVFKEWTNRCVCFHGAVYKKYRGKQTAENLRQCLDIVRAKLQCVFVTTQPSTNRLARKVVEKLGFKVKTIIPEGYRNSNGTYSDMCIYGEV